MNRTVGDAREETLPKVTGDPTLALAPAVILSWPGFYHGWILQYASSLEGPWTAYGLVPTLQDGQSSISVPTNGGLSFPAGVAVASDGTVYVSNRSTFVPPGSGEVIRLINHSEPLRQSALCAGALPSSLAHRLANNQSLPPGRNQNRRIAEKRNLGFWRALVF